MTASAPFFSRLIRPLSGCLAILALVASAIGADAQVAGGAPTSKGYSIGGTVVNAVTGEPVRRALVAVLAEEDSHTVGSVESDSEGRFSLGGLPAAKFQLTASKRGYLTAFYDEHGEYSTAIVTGEGLATGGLVFQLTPASVLHGVVTGDGGDPVEGARVMLFERPRDHGRVRGLGDRITQVNTATTDDTGAYDFNELAAGEYRLAVAAEPWYAVHLSSAKRSSGDAARALDVAYPVTFFDSTTDESSAIRIVLAGGRREEANINLHAVPALHLVVDTPSRPDGSIARAELRQTIFGAQVSAESAGFLDAMRTGTVEFTGVAPGRYELAQGDPPRVVELELGASQHVDPSLGTLTVPVSGSLRAGPGAAPPEDGTVSLIANDGTRGQAPLQAALIHGAFSFSTVPAGLWELWADAGGRALPVRSITVDGGTRAGNLVTVRDRPVQVVGAVSTGGTRVEGFARKGSKGMAGAMVVLAPRDPALHRALVRRDQSDSDGSFSLRDVAPGHYTVVAIEDGWELDWAQPEALARYLPRGIGVTVSEGAGKAVRLGGEVQVQGR